MHWRETPHPVRALLSRRLPPRNATLRRRAAIASPCIGPQGELAAALEYQDFTADTQDHEDHTFSGIFFDVSASEALPLKYVEVHSVWVRGALGPLTVWSTPGGHRGNVRDVGNWTRVYEKTHEANFTEFTELKLEAPVKLERGQRAGLYVHSTLPGDRAIVYDNEQYGSVAGWRRATSLERCFSPPPRPFFCVSMTRE